jgi:hypothetical protein
MLFRYDKRLRLNRLEVFSSGAGLPPDQVGPPEAGHCADFTTHRRAD